MTELVSEGGTGESTTGLGGLSVPLGVHVDAIIRREVRRIDERFRAERELLDQEFSAIEKATKLQAAEYERRLDMLNHAHEQARETLATYIPREAFESYVNETKINLGRITSDIQKLREELLPAELYNQKHDELEGKVNALEKWRENREGAQDSFGITGRFIVAAVTVMGVIVTIIVLVANNAI